jgi:SAM-dependent methyltransferase
MLPYGDLLLATDRPPPTEAELRPDFVMSVGAATIALANATVRRPVRRTLDLGCGCGTLGLLAAEHSAQVYALDRNPRAVEYARFNALFNGLSNVVAREGNLFDPVADLRGGFDLVVCNPPFIISPESRFLYRDSGMRGDEICRTIARQVPEFLAEGGLCQMLCNWAHVAGQDWRRHLAGWFEGGGCDIWVMRFETTDVAAYADAWAHKADNPAAMLEDWMAYYRQNGIEAVGLGLVCMRRRTGGRNWLRIEDGVKPARPIGDDIVTGLRVRDFLEEADDEALLASRLVAAPEVRLEQRCEPRDGGWAVTESVLSRDKGISARGAADPYVATLVARCTGRRPLGELVAELAASLGRSPAEVAGPLLGIVRQLLLQGLLVPADAVTSKC